MHVTYKQKSYYLAKFQIDNTPPLPGRLPQLVADNGAGASIETHSDRVPILELTVRAVALLPPTKGGVSPSTEEKDTHDAFTQAELPTLKLTGLAHVTPKSSPNTESNALPEEAALDGAMTERPGELKDTA